MRKIMLRLSPLLFLLLLFSCAKDREMIALEKEAIDKMELRGKERFCPCNSPDFMDVQVQEDCSVAIELGYDFENIPPECGFYVAEVFNLETGENTTLVQEEDFFFIEELASCAKFEIRVAHVGENCPPEYISETFKTPCEGCSICTNPCQQPDFINFKNINGCSTSVEFGFNEPMCGTFSLFYKNNEGGPTMVIDPVSSPVVLTNLQACTTYDIGISHVTDVCTSLPKLNAFTTSCKPCRECTGPCRPVDYLQVKTITKTSASISFGHNKKVCGAFSAFLVNNETGEIVYLNPVTSPLALNNLSPCTSYSFSISHNTDEVGCLPTRIDFMTEC